MNRIEPDRSISDSGHNWILMVLMLDLLLTYRHNIGDDGARLLMDDIIATGPRRRRIVFGPETNLLLLLLLVLLRGSSHHCIVTILGSFRRRSSLDGCLCHHRQRFLALASMLRLVFQ